MMEPRAKATYEGGQCDAAIKKFMKIFKMVETDTPTAMDTNIFLTAACMDPDGNGVARVCEKEFFFSERK